MGKKRRGDPSTVSGAKRGRKPKPKPLQAIDPTAICESTNASVREPPPLSEGGDIDVVLSSDPNPGVLPMLCLVNNEKLETDEEKKSSNEFHPVLEAVPEVDPLEIISNTKDSTPIHNLNPPSEIVDVPSKELSPNMKSHIIAQENPIHDNVMKGRTDTTCNPIYFNSPIYCKVLLNDSGDELDYSHCETRSDETPHRYKLRPRRKLFPQALALHRYQPDSDNEDSEEEFVLYVDDDSDEEDSACSDDFFEETSIGNNDNGPRKSSYQGGRGPRADLKALSLVTSCPVSVQWLVDNFEYHLGKSLPRGFVYDQYVLLCDQHGLEPVNAASFGKLIRSVFPGLKTRRLGTRGNSKYHYNGVYLKTTSPLRTLFNALRTQQGLMYDGGKRGRRVRKPMDQEMLRELLGIDDVDDIPSDLPPEEYLGKRPDMSKPFSSLMIDPAQIPPGIAAGELATFEKISYEHVSRLLLCFENFDLRGVTEELQRFWRVKCSDPNSQNRASYKQVLARAKLFKICTMPCVEDFIKSMDLFLYQGAIEILFPFLSREMPVTMHQGMRNFVKEIEIVMHKVLNGYPMKMCDIKMRCLRVFVSMWHDYSRLNKQVKSTCQILRSNESLRVMRSEFEKSISVEEAVEDDKDVAKLNAFSFIVKLIVDFSAQLKDQEQCIDSWVDWAHCTTEKLLMESYRQTDSKEVSVRPNAVEFWKAASDQIMGALAKWGSISIPHFKTFLSWCDHLISHMYKLVTATSEGFTLPSFYYFYHCLQPSTVPTIPRQMVLKIGSAGKRGKNLKFSSVLARRHHKTILAGKSESTDNKGFKDMKSKASTSVDQCDVMTTGEEPEVFPDFELFSFLDY